MHWKCYLSLKRNTDVTSCNFNDYVSLFDYRVATWPLAEITQHLLQTNLISHDAMWEMSRCDCSGANKDWAECWTQMFNFWNRPKGAVQVMFRLLFVFFSFDLPVLTNTVLFMDNRNSANNQKKPSILTWRWVQTDGFLEGGQCLWAPAP